MPKHGQQTQWRERHAAISKKYLDVDLLDESESIPTGIGKAPMPTYQTSPTSVASFLPIDLMPEMQPIVLPGAWTTVGKKGKPVKSEPKMYDLPKKAKKKKKNRDLRPEDDVAASALLEEAPSASACINELARSRLKKEKQSHGGKAIKHWVKRRHEKEMSVAARDELRARIDEDGIIIGDAGEHAPVKQRKKANGRREIARRRARHESTAARCYWPDEADGDDVSILEQAPPTKMPAHKARREASRPTLEGGSDESSSSSRGWHDAAPVSDKHPRSSPTSRGREKKKAKVAAEGKNGKCSVM